MTDIVITAAKRTPVGSFLGAFRSTSADVYVVSSTLIATSPTCEHPVRASSAAPAVPAATRRARRCDCSRC